MGRRCTAMGDRDAPSALVLDGNGHIEPIAPGRPARPAVEVFPVKQLQVKP